MEEKKSKLGEIRATAFDAATIMRQIGTPEFLESLTNIKDTTSKINDIIQGLQTPEMVKNIENFRKISENFNESATMIKETVQELKESGVIDKTANLVDSAKTKIESFGNDGNMGINSVIVSSQEMFASITGLVNEITHTISYSKKSATVTNIQDSIKGASEIYNNMVTR